MLTDESRRRLCEWKGERWHEYRGSKAIYCTCGKEFHILEEQEAMEHCAANNPTYSDWNSVMPLLAKIAADGEWEAFEDFCHDKFVGELYEERASGDSNVWLMGNFTDPEHTAGLVDAWLAGKEEGHGN